MRDGIDVLEGVEGIEGLSLEHLDPSSTSTPPKRATFAYQCVVDYGASARHVYIGIAANRGTTQVLQQIDLAGERGAKGLSIYSCSSITSEMWNASRRAPSRAPQPCRPDRGYDVSPEKTDS